MVMNFLRGLTGRSSSTKTTGSLAVEQPRSQRSRTVSKRSAFEVGGKTAPVFEADSTNPKLAKIPDIGPNNYNTRISSLRAKSRWFYVNDPFYRQACQQVANNTIHYGIKPNIKDRVLRKLWKKWVKEADVRGRMDFYGMQWSMGVGIPRDGEALVRFRPRRPSDMRSGIPFQLQLLEPDYMPVTKNEVSVSGNIITAGVERDAIERVTRYWLLDFHPRDYQHTVGTVEPKPVDASDVLHVYMPDRFSDTRGYPWAVSAMNTVERVRTYDEAELERKIGQATFGGFFKKPRLAGDEKNPLATNGEEIFEGLHPNTWMQLPEDWDVELVSPAATDSNYSTFRREHLSGLAVAIGFAVEMINLNFEKVNDRVYRAMMLEVQRKIESLQYHMFIHQFCQPVWERFVTEAYLADLWQPEDGKSVEDYFEIDFITPARGHIHPVQEIAAFAAAVKNGFVSRKRVTAQFGDDVEDIDEDNISDLQRSRAMGLNYEVYAEPLQGQAVVPTSDNLDPELELEDTLQE